MPDARLFVHFFDAWQDRLLLTELLEADYHQLSFLDQRVLAGRAQRWSAWSELEQLTVSAGQSSFIFHIGHVGSTLISRLLGELTSVLPVREPLILRTFAELEQLSGKPESPWPPDVHDRRLEMALEWLSRSFRSEQRPIVKATSFASEIAGKVGKARKSLFLYVRPSIYVQTILAGEASTHELMALRSSRLARLHSRLGEQPWQLWLLSLGEIAAMAWACEMSALEAAAARLDPEDVLWLDFEAFLNAPAQHLVSAAHHLGHELEEEQAARLIAGPIMQTYSKAPEHGYSPQLRQAVLAQAAQQHSRELDIAGDWLKAAVERHQLLGRCVARAGGL